jgi:lipopolysaccharide cholinephosphotransferase
MEPNISKECLQNAHSILFAMLSEIDRIFRQNNVRYCLAFGTLLGAVRHKGFIPWDDDIDIHVFDEDYDLALGCLRDELPANDFILHDAQSDPMYWCTFARVKSLKTEITLLGQDKERDFRYRGLHVALMRAPLTRRMNRLFYKILKELKNSHDYNKHRKDTISRFKLLICLTSIPLVKSLYKFIEFIPGRKIRIFGNNAWTGQFYKNDDVYPFSEVEFEEKLFFAPRNFLRVLEDAYGSGYMQLPPPEKREVHYKEIRFLDQN